MHAQARRKQVVIIALTAVATLLVFIAIDAFAS
jgi:hypothetical protein